MLLIMLFLNKFVFINHFSSELKLFLLTHLRNLFVKFQLGLEISDWYFIMMFISAKI